MNQTGCGFHQGNGFEERLMVTMTVEYDGRKIPHVVWMMTNLELAAVRDCLRHNPHDLLELVELEIDRRKQQEDKQRGQSIADAGQPR
jgi:hypothetical protein